MDPRIPYHSYEFVSNDLYLFSVMPYYHMSLWDYLKAQSVLDFDRRLEMVNRLLDGTSYLQTKHIIHFDIKPSNIMINLTVSGEWNETDFVLIDFGISGSITRRVLIL